MYKVITNALLFFSFLHLIVAVFFSCLQRRMHGYLWKYPQWETYIYKVIKPLFFQALIESLKNLHLAQNFPDYF